MPVSVPNHKKITMKTSARLFMSLYFILFVFTTNIWGSENDNANLILGDDTTITLGNNSCTSMGHGATGIYTHSTTLSAFDFNNNYVVISSPSNNEAFSTTTGFILKVDASHPAGFEWMRLWVEGDNINRYVYGIIHKSPWEFHVSGLIAGTYKLFIRARDKDGGTTDSETITVTLIDDDDLPPPAPSAIVKGPYLIYGNKPDEMTIMWEQEDADAGIVQWGPSTEYGENGTGSVSASALYGKLYKFTITDLIPGEKVHYQLSVNGQSAESFFYAVRTDVSEAVTFYVGGDSRTAPENPGHILTNKVFSRMLSDIDQNTDERNSLILYTGDVVNVGNSENDWQRWFKPQELRLVNHDPTPSIYDFLTRIPLMNTIGNHETYANDKDNLDWTLAMYRKYFPYNFANTTFDQLNGLYYSFTYGPVRVLILDNERPITVGDIQYNWLEDVLVNNTHPFVVAVYHRPAYGVGYNVNAWLWMQTDVVPLLKKHGVKIAFNGHDHFYNRSVVDGFHHVTTGGMTQLRDPGNASHSVKSAKQLHFARIEADPGTKKLTVTVINDQGEIIESFIVDYDTHVPATVNISSPADNATFDESTDFKFTIDATHPSGFEYMRLWAGKGSEGDEMLYVINESPWEFNVSDLNAGTYTFYVSAKDNNGGITVSEKITVTLLGATNINSFQANHVRVYPNPVYDSVVSVEFHLETLSNVSLSIMDVNGSVVSMPFFNKKFETGTQKLDVSLAKILPGTYFLQIAINDSRQTHKIVVM
jgi:hypothetical protein